MNLSQSQELKSLFQKGKIFAYPTEAVFGLGCDPLNKEAVAQLLKLKQRPMEKGLIVVADSYERASFFINEEEISQEQLKEIKSSWPGFVTWLVPKSEQVPNWITGGSELIAIRVSGHPVIQSLCKAIDSVLVSTSANITGQEAIKDQQNLRSVFEGKVVYIDGELGGADKPSLIKNALTGQIVRGN